MYIPIVHDQPDRTSYTSRRLYWDMCWGDVLFVCIRRKILQDILRECVLLADTSGIEPFIGGFKEGRWIERPKVTSWYG